MDEGLRHSRAERYVRDMDDSPDRWFYDGSTIYLIYGADVKSVSFDGETAGEMQVFASEDDDASDLYRYLNPNDQDSQPLEEEGIGSGYRLAISLIPSDYLIAEDLPAAISEVTNFMMYLVSEGNIDPSTVAVQMDTEFNEIDIVGIQDQDYEGMVEIHDALSQLMEEAPSNGYVYAIFTHPVIGMDFFPMNYGYPAGRRTMQQRMFQSEDVEVAETCIICGEPKTDSKRKYCCDVCTKIAQSKISGRTSVRQFLAAMDFMKRNEGQRLYAHAIRGGMYDRLKGGTPHVNNVSTMMRVVPNPEFIRYVENRGGYDYMLIGGDSLRDWLRPDLYAKIRSSVQGNLVRESAIVIEPTDSIVERVLAFNRALDASAMQQKLIEVQYAIKNGFATPQEAFAMLLGGEPLGVQLESPKVLNAEPESMGMVKCSNCGNRGHNKLKCPEPPKIEYVDPRILDDFEKWRSGESKMQASSRIKRNIIRILEDEPNGLGREQFIERYKINTGTQSKQRKEVSRLTRIANNMTSDVILWRDRYYPLGDGGKQGFFKTGPGSLQG